jgi:hypothetical protein
VGPPTHLSLANGRAAQRPRIRRRAHAGADARLPGAESAPGVPVSERAGAGRSAAAADDEHFPTESGARHPAELGARGAEVQGFGGVEGGAGGFPGRAGGVLGLGGGVEVEGEGGWGVWCVEGGDVEGDGGAAKEVCG